ncbi:hypothetical protein FNU76_06385 [Chitinimonas arctica]|uniref:Uncharacterized protein n=1 Tax=Chitinimonas arctica TaxID=2594795 RepID=A0A516SCY1_9NEIS|nr:hypothetical protein FNU76_06385 [Chitinimonas arctica]
MSSHKSRRLADPSTKGMEIFEITPIILGGDPTDSSNKVMLTRKQHIEAVRYWNEIIDGLKKADE